MFAFVKKRKSDELGAPRKKPVKKKTPVKKRPSVLSQAQASALGATKRNTPNWLGNSTDDNNISEANNAAISATAKNRATGGNRSSNSTAQTISLFTFGWTGVSKKDTYTSLFSLKEYHDRFNKKIVAAFPKIENAVPFTSYTDRSGGGYIAESQITATAETTLSPNATREKVIQLAKDSGFTGDLARVEFSQRTIKQIQNNDLLVLPKSTVNPNTITRTKNQTNTRTKNTKSNSNNEVFPDGNAPGGFMDAILGEGFGNSLGSALGLSTPVVILIAVIVGIIVLKK